MTINHLEVEGFRGVNRPLKIAFGERATVLSGPNGKGKTSILGAIEWCLFGELRYQERENASRDELVNLHHPEGSARVTLTLDRPGEKFLVARERKTGRRGSSLRVTGPGRKTFSDEEADAFLFHLTGLTFEDFYRAVFLHQESVRGLLLEKPRFRDEALDRLFGLEKLRDVLASIPMKRLSSAIDEIESKKLRLTERLSGAAGELERQRERCLEEATELGFSEDELTVASGKTLSQGIQLEVRRVGEEMGLETERLTQATMVDDIEKFSRRAKEFIRDARLSRGQALPVDQTTNRLVGIGRVRKDLEEAVRLQVETEATLVALQKDAGALKDVKETMEGLRREVAEWEANLKELDVRTRVVSDALLYFEAVSEASSCPVCQQRITVPSLVRRLKDEVQGTQLAEIQRLTDMVDEANDKLRKMGDTREELERLEVRREGDSEHVQEVLPRAGDLLGRQFGDAKAALEALQEEEKRVIGQLEGLKDAQNRTEERLQQIDVKVDRLRALGRFLKAEEEFVRLREKAPADEADTEASSLQEELDELLDLQNSLQTIIQAINAVATERARDAIEGTRGEMSDFYRTICNHPYFDNLRIEVAQKSAAGVQKNSYSIRAFSTQEGKSTLASSRLSTAQMNCVALSVYLSQSRVLAHSLGFLILDDPSQNLDAAHKLALAAVLGRLAAGQQVIVATHDVEFEKALRNSLVGDGTNTYALEWSPRVGTQLTVA